MASYDPLKTGTGAATDVQLVLETRARRHIPRGRLRGHVCGVHRVGREELRDGVVQVLVQVEGGFWIDVREWAGKRATRGGLHARDGGVSSGAHHGNHVSAVGVIWFGRISFMSMSRDVPGRRDAAHVEVRRMRNVLDGHIQGHVNWYFRQGLVHSLPTRSSASA